VCVWVAGWLGGFKNRECRFAHLSEKREKKEKGAFFGRFLRKFSAKVVRPGGVHGKRASTRHLGRFTIGKLVEFLRKVLLRNRSKIRFWPP